MNSYLAIGILSLGICLAFLVLEQILLRLARRRLRVVIQVNGTRGKSTVTRMLHAILRDAGYRVWGKTTGTEARLLFPDGSETRIRRLGPANVREQRNMLFKAALSGVDALVFECNAIAPDLQLVATSFLHPDLTVITNARTDHRREQGEADEAAFAFAAAIRDKSAVATSDAKRRSFWENAASQKGAQFFYVDPAEAEGLALLPENAACALAVADWLGLSRKNAATAISSHQPDPGAFRLLSWREADGGRVWFADATAANDPESTERLALLAAATAAGEGMNEVNRVLVVAVRSDRPDRSLLFAEYAAACGGPGAVFEETVFLGSLSRASWVVLKRSGIKFRVAREPQDILFEKPVGDLFIVAAGNRHGIGQNLHDWAMTRFAAGQGGVKSA